MYTSVDPVNSDSVDLRRAAASWILKTRECHRIPFSVMDSIIHDVQSLYEVALAQLSDRVKGALNDGGVKSDIQESVAAEFTNGPHSQMFAGLTTTTQQMAYFKQHFNYVAPVKIVLGTQRKTRGSGAKRRLVEKEDSFMYIPLLDTLENLLNDDTILAEFDEHTFHLRTRDLHLQHCQALDAADDWEGCSKEYGINRRSSLLELHHFDMCSGSLIPDVMHDLLEGVLQHILKHLLHVLSNERKYFTLAYLNGKVVGMELGYMEDNRPSPLTRGNKVLRQNASQTWTLGRLLPIMVGHLVPDDDEYWKHYLTTLQISNYLLAPEIHPDEVAYLNVILPEHHEMFTQLYPDVSVIPKMHYLLHAPRLMFKFGPLVRYWTMRYEARHHFFKRLAQNIGNYINLSYTLAQRHQLLQCYFHQSQTFLDNEIEIGPGDTVAVGDRPAGLQTESTCYRARWVKVAGVLYKSPCALLLKVNNDYPQYGRLSEILVVNGSSIMFNVCVLDTLTFLSHFNGYCVSPSQSHQVIELSCLHSPFPVHIHHITTSGITKQVIVPKYHISGCLY